MCLIWYYRKRISSRAFDCGGNLGKAQHYKGGKHNFLCSGTVRNCQKFQQFQRLEITRQHVVNYYYVHGKHFLCNNITCLLLTSISKYGTRVSVYPIVYHYHQASFYRYTYKVIEINNAWQSYTANGVIFI